MAYSADSFTAGEQPTTTKFNKLWNNDASFNDGTGIGTNAIAAASLAASAITLGYAQITGVVTTASLSVVQATGLTVSVTIPAGGRRIKITAYAFSITNNTNSDGTLVEIWDGTVGSGTQLAQANVYQPAGVQMQVPVTVMAVVAPAAGAKTYNVGFCAVSGGTSTLSAGSYSPAFILVEAI